LDPALNQWGRVVKSPSRDRRTKKRANESRQSTVPDAVKLPEPPVLPDVYTKDRRSIHPTQKEQPKPPSKRADDRQK
jgi:hypothetical protein